MPEARPADVINYYKLTLMETQQNLAFHMSVVGQQQEQIAALATQNASLQEKVAALEAELAQRKAPETEVAHE